MSILPHPSQELIQLDLPACILLYRRPSSDLAKFLADMDTKLSNIPNSPSQTMGDFNIDVSSTMPSTHQLELASSHYFHQCVNEPTRVTPHSSSTIDLGFVSDPVLLYKLYSWII